MATGEILNFTDSATVTWTKGAQTGTDPVYGLPIFPLTAEALGPGFADEETVSGSGTSWTLAHAPNPAASLMLVQRLPNFGGIVLIRGVDYTISGATITTINSLSSGVLTAWYRY